MLISPFVCCVSHISSWLTKPLIPPSVCTDKYKICRLYSSRTFMRNKTAAWTSPVFFFSFFFSGLCNCLLSLVPDVMRPRFRPRGWLITQFHRWIHCYCSKTWGSLVAGTLTSADVDWAYGDSMRKQARSEDYRPDRRNPKNLLPDLSH